MGLEAIKMVDLFAGIGGIRLGFEQVFHGAKTVFVSEWDRWASQTYQDNFGTVPSIAGDIREIEASSIPSFNICLAGFPCQAFSIAGRRKGLEDDYRGYARGSLFAEVVRICEHHKPEIIFCENVKGLVSHKNGSTFAIICGAFEEIGYRVFAKVLNSKDFGVPQNRERIYLVCIRKDLVTGEFIFPVGTCSAAKLRNILEPAPIDARYYLSEHYLNSLREHKARNQKKGNGFGYVVRDLDGISGALMKCDMGKTRNLIIDDRPHSLIPTTKIHGNINTENIRYLTPREWARLQGFPEQYPLNQADTHLYAQLGNSVTIPVIVAIAQKIKEYMYWLSIFK